MLRTSLYFLLLVVSETTEYFRGHTSAKLVVKTGKLMIFTFDFSSSSLIVEISISKVTGKDDGTSI